MLKNKILILIIFLFALSMVGYVHAKNQTYPLLGKVIYLDPGHGGADSGAFYKNVKESDLNLEISHKIMTELKKDGAVVYLTRYGDYDLSITGTEKRKRSDLSRRADIINQSGCDLYLSIHLNADVDTSWYGAQAYYDKINSENKFIAEIYQNQFIKYLGSKRKYKEDSTLYLQRRITKPGILLELGFLSNPNERELLQDGKYQEKIAKAVCQGTREYFID